MSSLISPAERECPQCSGVGRGADFELCSVCDGLGRTWLEGGPGFGCKRTLADCNVDDVVTLGCGERGRISHQNDRGPTTRIHLEDFFGDEAPEATPFPSCVGVSSLVPSFAQRDDKGNHPARQDFSDPLQRTRL